MSVGGSVWEVWGTSCWSGSYVMSTRKCLMWPLLLHPFTYNTLLIRILAFNYISQITSMYLLTSENIRVSIHFDIKYVPISYIYSVTAVFQYYIQVFRNKLSTQIERSSKKFYPLSTCKVSMLSQISLNRYCCCYINLGKSWTNLSIGRNTHFLSESVMHQYTSDRSATPLCV